MILTEKVTFVKLDIRRWCARNGFSISALADTLGIERRNLQRWASAGKVKTIYAYALAAVQAGLAPEKD